MKKTLIFIITLLPVIAAAQKGYVISGKLTEMKTPAKAYLSVVEGARWVEKDSSEVKNGDFRFSGKTDIPVLAIVTVRRLNVPQGRNERDYLSFFLENSGISITGKDSVRTAVVSGSFSEKEHSKLEASIRPLTNTIIRLNDEFQGKPKDEAYKKASDSVVMLVAKIRSMRRKFAEEHLDTFIGLYVYNLHVLDSKFDPAVEEPLFHRFSKDLQASALGKNSIDKIEAAKRRQAGVKVTDFTQSDLNGQPFKLSSLRGKYVLVDFWASWCVPCRAENPNLVKAYRALKDKNFEVVGVSLDEAKASWAAAVEKDGLPWIHVSDLKGWKNDVAVLYGINSVPQNILINPQGVIIAKNLRGEDLTSKLSALIK